MTESIIKAGKIENLGTLGSCFEWRIPCMGSINQENDARRSPEFMFCNGVWTFTIANNCDHVFFNIRRDVKTGVHQTNLHWELSIVKSGGREQCLIGKGHDIADGEIWNQCYPVHTSTFSWDGERDEIKSTCFLQCSECCSPFRRKPSNDDRIVFSETLSQNLKDFFLASSEGDVVIKVQEKEFAAHRMVLQARSPVFCSMFGLDMLEKKTGIVYVKDIEPHIFYNVLLYLYTGEVTGLQSDTFYQIFAFANMYDLEELKSECVKFVYHNLSEEILYDALKLAHLYDEQKIIDLAKRFIANRRKKIFPSHRWKIFKAENPAVIADILESILAAKDAEK